MRSTSFILGAAALAAIPSIGSGALYTQTFDIDDTANWAVNKSTGLNANDAGSSAEFFYDYSTAGIPSAPGSGGTTRGLRLRANMSGAIFSGLSVSPTGQSFSGDYQMSFNMWLNYNGPLGPTVIGGNGSTQAMGAGLDTTGTVAQWAGGAHDTVWFSSTVDGASAQDYRAYPKGPIAIASSGYYAAGTGTSPDARNNTHPYYAGFGGEAAPAAQVALFPNQTGTTGPGTQGFAWRDVLIQKVGTTQTWFIDGVEIAEVTGITGDGSNIFFSHYDTNGTISTDPNAPAMLFTLIDNVVVDVVPEPTSLALLALGGLALAGRRRR